MAKSFWDRLEPYPLGKVRCGCGESSLGAWCDRECDMKKREKMIERAVQKAVEEVEE